MTAKPHQPLLPSVDSRGYPLYSLQLLDWQLAASFNETNRESTSQRTASWSLFKPFSLFPCHPLVISTRTTIPSKRCRMHQNWASGGLCPRGSCQRPGEQRNLRQPTREFLPDVSLWSGTEKLSAIRIRNEVDSKILQSSTVAASRLIRHHWGSCDRSSIESLSHVRLCWRSASQAASSALRIPYSVPW